MKRIIVIDDDAINNYLCEMTIKVVNKNVKTECYTNPQLAASMVINENHDDETVILLDINMPVMDGWQFLKEMANNNVEYPVYILTSSINPTDKSNADKFKNVKNFFSKPLNFENINEVLSNS